VSFSVLQYKNKLCVTQCYNIKILIRCVFSTDDDNPVPGNEANHLATLPEEEAAVAMMGLPRAGEITRAQLRIKESKEFKVFRINSLLMSSLLSHRSYLFILRQQQPYLAIYTLYDTVEMVTISAKKLSTVKI
jgi:hypothetical protein